MKKLLISIAALLVFCTCKDKKENTDADVASPAPPVDTTAITPTFFPVTSYLKGQLSLLDSMPVTFLQVSKKGNQLDSSWLNLAQLKPQLAPFLALNIERDEYKKLFKETKFKDQTTDAITYTYNPVSNLPDSVSLRQWMVYVQPETGTVKRVFLVQKLNEGNQQITRQLTWVSSRNAHMIDIANKKDGSAEVIRDVRWVWNFTPEETSEN